MQNYNATSTGIATHRQKPWWETGDYPGGKCKLFPRSSSRPAGIALTLSFLFCPRVACTSAPSLILQNSPPHPGAALKGGLLCPEFNLTPTEIPPLERCCLLTSLFFSLCTFAFPALERERKRKRQKYYRMS